MFNRLLQFINITYQWISAEVQNAATAANTNIIQPTVQMTQDVAQWWYGYARRLTPWILIVVSILFLLAIGVNYWAENGIMTSVIGMMIAIILFPLLVWYTPLVAVIGAVRKILELDIKGAPTEIEKSSTKWLNTILGILTWEMICTFMLSVIPFWNRIESLPFILLTGILLMMTGLLWVAKPWYQKCIRGAVIAVFAFHTIACFFPPFVEAIQYWSGIKMEVLANWMTEDADDDHVNTNNPKIATLLEDFNYFDKGEEVAVVGRPIKRAGQYEYTVEVVKSVGGVYKGKKEFVPYRLLSFNKDTIPAPGEQKDAQAKEEKSSGITVSFTVNPGKPYKIDKIKIKKGQKFTFNTYDAPIEFRVKDDESSCWSRVTNNLPWRAVVSGELQVKAGNIPANVTLSIEI